MTASRLCWSRAPRGLLSCSRSTSGPIVSAGGGGGKAPPHLFLLAAADAAPARSEAGRRRGACLSRPQHESAAAVGCQPRGRRGETFRVACGCLWTGASHQSAAPGLPQAAQKRELEVGRAWCSSLPSCAPLTYSERSLTASSRDKNHAIRAVLLRPSMSTPETSVIHCAS